MKYKLVEMPERKHIALVAHDNMKPMLSNWCAHNKDILARHRLSATGTTAQSIESSTGLSIEKFFSGPLGGDQQIGARIAEQQIHVLIFFWDPLASMPHDPDVKALLRLAAVWNIPVACNSATADFLIQSSAMNESFEHLIPDYEQYKQQRSSL